MQFNFVHYSSTQGWFNFDWYFKTSNSFIIIDIELLQRSAVKLGKKNGFYSCENCKLVHLKEYLIRNNHNSMYQLKIIICAAVQETIDIICD